MRRLILRTNMPPGDVVTLTAAVRDLHRSQPGRFAVDVRTNHPDLWSGNPWITAIPDEETGAEMIEMRYPSIHESWHSPRHIIEGFSRYLSEVLGVAIATTEFRGDIHLTQEERARPPVVAGPYWIIAAGGKRDFTVKWWATERWQGVVDALRGRVQFVQVGAATDCHPRLSGVVDMVGRTSLRDLVLLTHHASGVLCPITLPMHISAAVPRPDGVRGLRPCVVVAGGREPAHWFSYPGHRVLDVIGSLPCCALGGCWRARTRALGDGSRLDAERLLCADVDGDLPRCMSSITVEDVVRAVLRSFSLNQESCQDSSNERQTTAFRSLGDVCCTRECPGVDPGGEVRHT